MTRTAPPVWAVRTEADRRAIAAGYFWDQRQADRIVGFAEKYITQQYGAGEFRLFEWQRRFFQSIYGWRRPDGGRRFKRVLLHVPKKNGKTLLVSILAAYELFAAGVRSPLVCSASTTKDNAKQVYDQLVATIKGSEKLKALARPVAHKKLIEVKDRGGEYRALSADAPAAEGLNCSAVIVDEAHAHRSPKLYQTLEYAMIGRENGLIVIISTAGDDLTHWYYALVEQGRSILKGADLDPSMYAEVYEADPEADDLDDPVVWKRVNPSLDLYPGYTTERFREDREAKKTRTVDRLNFERYRLNIFRKTEEATWIDLCRWDACRSGVWESDLVGRPLYLGFDASQRIDPTSLSAVWVLDGRRFAVRSWAWVAEGGVREREKSNLPRYQQFAADGAMVITPGDVIQKSGPLGKIEELVRAGHAIKALVMDPNGAWVVGEDLNGKGFEIYRQPQNNRWFNGPTRELDTAVIERRIVHDGNSWLRWCVNSVRLDEDKFENVRPLKKKSADHIDGAIALLMAFAYADLAASTPQQPSVYETRGFRTL